MRTIVDELARSSGERMPSVTFSALADVLRWARPPDEAVSRLERRYSDVLGARLGEVLASIYRADPALGAHLAVCIERSPEARVRAALLAPETSRRLVTRLHAFQDVRDHLQRFFGTENPPPLHDKVIGELGECIPVTAETADDPRLAHVLRHLEYAHALLSKGCKPAAAFVTRVTRRVLLQVDDARDGFASNSPQGLVGQAVLTNGHLPMVDDVVLAEALVHESIHGFVGMSEAIGLAGRQQDERWLADDRFYEGFSCTVSPWTGKALDLPTYLHACFVWWGLLQLWASLSGTGHFDERRVRSRIARAARGFMDRALVRQLHCHRAAIHPELLAAFDAMGREVSQLMADTGLDVLLGRMEPVANA